MSSSYVHNYLTQFKYEIRSLQKHMSSCIRLFLEPHQTTYDSNTSVHLKISNRIYKVRPTLPQERWRRKGEKHTETQSGRKDWMFINNIVFLFIPHYYSSSGGPKKTYKWVHRSPSDPSLVRASTTNIGRSGFQERLSCLRRYGRGEPVVGYR